MVAILDYGMTVYINITIDCRNEFLDLKNIPLDTRITLLHVILRKI
mgnify:CR=1 FL=1